MTKMAIEKIAATHPRQHRFIIASVYF